MSRQIRLPGLLKHRRSGGLESSDLTQKPSSVKYVNKLGLNMATKHNITVAIELSLLKKARAIAASRGRSVSALLADELRELVAEDARYLSARKRALALFSSPLPLGWRTLEPRRPS
jgi:hypothetical protein